MKEYKCTMCKKVFRFSSNPKYCPCCGSPEVIPNNEKAKNKAMNTIEEIKEITLRLDVSEKEYVILLAQYEDKMQLLRQYKKRGVIEGNEIPKREKKKIQETLRELRNEKRK